MLRPGSLRGSRAAAVPGPPPASWAPCLLAAHVAVLVLLSAVSAVLHLSGWRSSGYDEVGRWTGPPLAVPVATWVLALLVVVVVARAVGPRRPGRLAYWLTGTACWAVLPWAWLATGLSASQPEGGWAWVTVIGFSLYGWVWLLPLLGFGAVFTAVLARFPD
ncbi:hypothetical protein ACI8AA_09820 [Geodermatophilus sp. SYSU D01180]